MIKKIYSVLCLMVCSCLLSGCIEEYEADIEAEDDNLLVVEGTICSSQLNQFSLSRTQPLYSYDPHRLVTGAKVSVRGSDGSEYVTQESLGNYICWIDALDPDVDYYLHIEIGGDVYESEPQKPLPTEPIAEVLGVQNTPESNIDVLVTPDVPFESDKVNFYSWTYDETWEVHSDYTTRVYFDTELMKAVFKENQFPERGWKDGRNSDIMVGASTNYDRQHIQRLKIYGINRSSEHIYYMYSGMIHQRAISKAEYEYELARRQAGSGMGGLFTPLPSALPTNIRCLTSRKHVIGFVGCSLNTSDYRFFLNANDFSVYRSSQKDTRIWFDDTSMEDCLWMVDRGMFLCVWEDKRMEPGGRLRTAWATENQLDVRAKGAYIEKPDYWPSEE